MRFHHAAGRRLTGEARMGGLATVLTIVGAAGAGGCQAPQLTGPAPAVLAVTEVQNPCTRLGFKLFPNGDVLGTMPPAPCAGSPVAFEPGAAPVWGFVSSPNPVLRIKVRVRNQATAAVGWPRLALALSGKTVTTPAGTNPASILSGEVDSLRTDSTAVWLLTGDGGQTPEVLAPGAATASKTLYFRIPPPITEGAFEFSILMEGGAQDTTWPVGPLDYEIPGDSTALVWSTTPDGPQAYYRNILNVYFHDSLPGAVVRQALSSLGATVIGMTLPQSRNALHGLYILQFTDPGPTAAHVDSLLARVKAASAVRLATKVYPIFPIRLDTRIPIDGVPGSNRMAWRLSSATPTTRAFLAVNAPLAWGCVTGSEASPQPKIGILDFAFDPTHEDLAGSFSGGAVPLLAPRVSNQLTMASTPIRASHGTAMAGIIGATGNNGLGRSGLLWKANLQLYPFAIGAATPLFRQASNEFATITEVLRDARQRGVRVLSISGAFVRSSDSTESVELQGLVREYLNEGTGNLLVISAGNYNSPAMQLIPISVMATDTIQFPYMLTRAVAALSTEFPKQVLWVSATGDDGGTLASSGRVLAPGAIAAPGGQIDVLVRPGDYGAPYTTVDTGGTSTAAAFVSGVAGLILSANGALSGAEVGDYILQGAAVTRPNPFTGVETPTGLPNLNHLNAYESLKLAARRPGAPLCGNRVWSELSGGQSLVRVERQGVDEVIYTAPATDTLSLVFPAHGGRKIYTEAFTPNSIIRRELAWGPAGWSATTLPGFDDSSWSGTTWSFFGWTHDADSVSHPRRAGYGGQAGPAAMNFTVSLGTQGSVGRTVGTFTGPSMPPPTWVIGKRFAIIDSTGALAGYHDSQAPGDSIIASSFDAATVTTHPSPMNDRVFVVVNYFRYQSNLYTGWGPCPGATPVGSGYSCEERHSLGTAGSVRTEVWGSSAWGSGALSKLWERTGQTISWLGLAEQSAMGIQDAVIGIGVSNAMPFVGFPGTFTSCAVEYVNIVTGTTTKAARPADPRMTCQFGAGELGTLAPVAPNLIAPRLDR